ncbi:MAG: FGGY-family carbohydrate kinase [Clostridiales bacterium]|nr:FGGY-family carbohydrate kinase [Clostridiales bacterium]
MNIQFERAVLGVEFGSTRIKAVLLDENHAELASGDHEWENRLENGIWTYSMEDVWGGLQDAYGKLKAQVKERYGTTITTLGAIGLSAMMHGYMPFNAEGELMVPFRTWRNTITLEASEALMELFQYPIPQRWSIAHLYQAVLNKEPHVPDITFITTLEGYVHWKLTGRKVIGIGEASGMFPIDSSVKQYNAHMLDQFAALPEVKDLPWDIHDILPEILLAGDDAGMLTAEGAKLLDPEGDLMPGIPLCPPEGDAGTGMTATNSVAVRTGNVSAGTSVFAMIVLEKPLSRPHPEIDLVTTPSGEAVAMVHCNNCTSDINAWVHLFRELFASFDVEVDTGRLYETLFKAALSGDKTCGGLLTYNYFSGEHVTGLEEGRPMLVRMPDADFSLANFMRANLYSAVGALKTGLDILFKEEEVKVDRIYGHGGFFKTEAVGQKILAAAMDAPVSVMATAGEGGAYGIAILAAYMLQKKDGETLEQYLNERIFKDAACVTIQPDPEDVVGFDAYIEKYAKGLAIEKEAVEQLK